MNQSKLTFFVLLMAILGGTHAALALSTQDGNTAPGNYLNLTDPDEKMPIGVKGPHDQLDSNGAGNWGSNSPPPIIVRQNNLLRQDPGAPFNPYNQAGQQR